MTRDEALEMIRLATPSLAALVPPYGAIVAEAIELAIDIIEKGEPDGVATLRILRQGLYSRLQADLDRRFPNG